MTVIVTDTGFAPDTFIGMGAAAQAGGAANPRVLDLPPTADVSALVGQLEAVEMIRIAFPSFSDGRGFTLARRLRLMGYTGRLRAAGHLIADQYAMARRAGFDEVEISDDLAARQPVAQWMFRVDWRAHDYQSRLRA